MKKVTIQDIADALGISRNTVSKAINNSDGLADATREKILQKAVEMGYKQFSYIQAQARLGLPSGQQKGEIALLIGDVIDGSQGALVIAPEGSADMKTWTGKVSNADGKVTITDDKTKESITVTVTKAEDDGALTIESDEHGKGVLVKMTVGDWMALNEKAKDSKAK